MPQPKLDPVEREALAYVIRELQAGRTCLCTDTFRPFLISLGAEDRFIFILKYFEGLGILTPENSRRNLRLPSPLVGRVISAYWRIEGKAVSLYREIQDLESSHSESANGRPGEPESDSQESFPGVKGKREPPFDHWAFGMEAEDIWHLFRRVTENGSSHWRHQRKIQGLPRGKLQQIMKKLAEGEGFVSRKDLAALICRAPPRDRSKYKGQILAPLSRLRAVLRQNVDGSAIKADLLPWDKSQEGWRAKVEIGYAIQVDSRLEFRMHSQVQT